MRAHISGPGRVAAGLLTAGMVVALAGTPAAAHGLPAAPAPAPGSLAWSIRPAGPDGRPDARTHFTLQTNPGGQVVDHALITNLSARPVTFRVYATDAFNTASGGFDLLTADRRPTDVGAWVSFPAPTVAVPAGGSVAVPFTVSVPVDATPGDHSGGVVVSLTVPGASANQAQVNLDERVAARLYLRVSGPLRPELRVGPVVTRYEGTDNPFGGGRLTVTYSISNPGNVRLRSHPKLSVTGPFAAPLARAVPADLPEILPGQRATFSTVLHGVFPLGPLAASVALTPYPDAQQPVGQKIPVARGTAHLWATPWLLLIIIAVLALAALAIWWLPVRRRRAGPGAPDAGANGRTPVGAGAGGGGGR